VQCGAAIDRNMLAGRGFAPYTFSVAPRIGLLDNQLQLFALAEGQYGRTGMDSAHLWGSFYNNSLISRTQTDPLWKAQDFAVGRTGTGWHMGLYDADFWKLREVGMRYNLPNGWIERTGAERASLAFSARNVWTIWRAEDNRYGHQITDPEFGDPTALAGDGNFYSQPPLSSVSLTLRVTF
jgi:hypothetical protein